MRAQTIAHLLEWSRDGARHSEINEAVCKQILSISSASMGQNDVHKIRCDVSNGRFTTTCTMTTYTCAVITTALHRGKESGGPSTAYLRAIISTTAFICLHVPTCDEVSFQHTHTDTHTCIEGDGNVGPPLNISPGQLPLVIKAEVTLLWIRRERRFHQRSFQQNITTLRPKTVAMIRAEQHCGGYQSGFFNLS